jgi:hypothetical protein
MPVTPAFTPVIPAVRRLRHCKFEASLGYVMRLSPKQKKLGMVVYTCNPSNLEGGGRREGF